MPLLGLALLQLIRKQTLVSYESTEQVEPCVFLEDQAITESMGTIYDRTNEHLGTTDSMVIRVRRALIRAANSLQSEGTVPLGVDQPEVYAQRSGGVILPRSADWFEATRGLRKAFVHHTREQIEASLGRSRPLTESTRT